MYVAHLSLTDFRCYPQVELAAASPGITALVGPNGQGKTNLVEAIGYVATLGSHRVADRRAAGAGRGRRGRSSAPRVVAASGPRSTLVELEITPGKANRARLNRLARPAAARGARRPAHGAVRAGGPALVKGDPDGRRRFLDDLLVQLAPAVRRACARTTTGCSGSATPC